MASDPTPPRARTRHVRTRHARTLALAGAATAVLVTAGVLVAPLSASAYPTWSEVKAAKGDASATKTQVDAIDSALTSLRSEANARSTAAIKADAANQKAQGQLAAAPTAATALDDQVAAEKKKASEAHQEAGQLAAHLYRIGSSSQLDGQLFSGSKTDSTLYKLGALSQLTKQWQTVLDQATVASKAVSSLSAQAKVAEAERDRRASNAKTTLAAAQTAQAAANTAVASATSHQQTLEAQLASLDAKAAKTLVGYKNGVMARAIALQQQKDKEAAEAKAAADAQAKKEQEAASTRSGGSSGASATSTGTTTSTPATSPSGGSTSTGSSAGLGTGVVDDPAGAQAYASGQLASHGWASSQMSCLVSLWNQESGWRTSALNVSSGAYGIPQSLPAEKMSTYGLDWQTNYRTQINWGLAYIAAAYGSPCGAWAHEVAHNWY